MALRAGTALIGFGQAAEATGHEDPVRKFANNLGVSNKVYDTASEAIPFLTALGCMGAPAVLQYSALISGGSLVASSVDTVASMSQRATEAEEHYRLAPHVHQPIRNVTPNGIIFGRTGKTVGFDTLSPSKKDVKQLYEYIDNGKYNR